MKMEYVAEGKAIQSEIKTKAREFFICLDH